MPFHSPPREEEGLSGKNVRCLSREATPVGESPLIEGVSSSMVVPSGAISPELRFVKKI